MNAVFSINFLRRQTMPLRLRRALAYAALGLAAANGLLFVWLLASAAQLWGQERTLHAGLGPSALSAPHLDALAAELRPLQQRVEENLRYLQGMIAIQRQRLPIAGKLAALAATLPARTWIVRLSGAREERALTIEAAYVIDPAAPADLPINEWVSALKADARFGERLRRVEMVSSSRDVQGRAELMRFTLDAAWEPSEAGAL